MQIRAKPTRRAAPALQPLHFSLKVCEGGGAYNRKRVDRRWDRVERVESQLTSCTLTFDGGRDRGGSSEFR